MIGIVDYGLGNLRSVANALEALNQAVRLLRTPGELRSVDKIILPGVGAFGDGMENLRRAGWLQPLKEAVLEGKKPFLGICLGMQLLGTVGTELGAHQGLDWVPGEANRLAGGPGLRVPHVGWNEVRVLKRDGLYRGLGERETFYFVHSYALEPRNTGVVTGVVEHGREFAASVEAGPVWATQFHPEKSQKAGAAVLMNFAER